MYYRGISHALYAICRDEGISGLYKGLGGTLLGVGPSIAISLSVYETLRSHWQLQGPHDSAVFVSWACGSLFSMASSTVIFPIRSSEAANAVARGSWRGLCSQLGPVWNV
ncbi:calcium-binding mitochondrial carrier protein SCaMC-2-A-like isoform X3 [Phoenix dactylifera]|uniref:Calcium-binding mitochondrial carrier protein SCaMC-2-A-like isoform X3 n=1 Tax=Phoenix dactylifera TaxID=42345 RepID=A0A8B9AXK6_PHODC|nr:calcium-binding mitochondrial carrier protein SCaMC-2-A-like isoform X3 [Phoenix dactylifera]